MKAVWLHRGGEEFSAVEIFISCKIWGHPKKMPGDTAIVSVSGRGDALGAALFYNYSSSHGTIEISGAGISGRWLSRAVLYEMFAYPFNQLGCQAVYMQCDPGDAVLARIFAAYGFQRYDIPRLRGRDKAQAVYVLGDDVWRNNGFHKEKNL